MDRAQDGMHSDLKPMAINLSIVGLVSVISIWSLMTGKECVPQWQKASRVKYFEQPKRKFNDEERRRLLPIPSTPVDLPNATSQPFGRR